MRHAFPPSPAPWNTARERGILDGTPHEKLADTSNERPPLGCTLIKLAGKRSMQEAS